jgi:intracellular sulfur oxidation DsrE/DsrF family protein
MSNKNFIFNTNSSFSEVINSGELREFLILIDKSWEYIMDFSQILGNSSVRIVVLIMCDNSKIKLNIKNYINWVNEINKTNILNFAKNGEVDIMSELEIDDKWAGSKWELHIENIFLGENVKISGVPRLNIKLDKTRANHSLKALKIKDEDLFYLSSRWLSEDSSKFILLKWKIQALLDLFENKDKEMESEIMEKFEGFIKNN